MAGGVRRGRGPGRGRSPASPDDPGTSPDAPVVACWEGRIARGRPARRGRGRARGGRATPSAGSPGSTPPAARSRRGSIDPHTHLLFAGTREGELVLRQRGRVATSTSSRPAAGSSRRSRRRGPRPTRSCWPTAGAGSTRCSATASRRSRRSPATAWTSRPSCGCSRSPTGSARRARSTSCRRGSARTPSRRSSGPGRTAPRRTSARSSRSSCPGSPPRAGPASPTSSAKRACSAPTSRGGSSRRRAAYGLLPRLHADELAPSGGAELAAELGAASADHLATPSADGHRRDGRRGRRTSEPVVATLLPVTTWFLMKDHHAPARAFIDARRAGRDRHRLQSRHVADGEPAAGDDVRLPQPADDARTRRWPP